MSRAVDAPSPWFDPGRHADRRGFLRARSAVKAALRRWFEAEGFCEVEAGILQVSPGNETHLHGFATTITDETGQDSRLHLHTSPEFAMKKLLAAGETAIFDFARVFRNRERSALHHPEFTMLEWYRSGCDYEAMVEDVLALVTTAAKAAGTDALRFKDVTCSAVEAERLTVSEAFGRYAGITLEDSLNANGSGRRDALAEAMTREGLRVAEDDTWSDLFAKVLTDRIEPHLGHGRLTVLCDYPASEAALARRKPSDRRFAERFELYACGVELCNAFSELTDPAEQRLRFEDDMAEKQRRYGYAYPIDEDFLRALALMPPAAGCAMGFDRLVLLATGARRIEDVLWTPVPEHRA